LVRSRHDGVCFDRIEPAFQRYVAKPVVSRHEIWSFRHRISHMPTGKILRLIVSANATIIWTADHWAHTNASDTVNNHTLSLWFADLPTEQLPAGGEVEFTFFWNGDRRWEGKNFLIAIDGAHPAVQP